jgi:hypothetical protein
MLRLVLKGNHSLEPEGKLKIIIIIIIYGELQLEKLAQHVKLSFRLYLQIPRGMHGPLDH